MRRRPFSPSLDALGGSDEQEQGTDPALGQGGMYPGDALNMQLALQQKARNRDLSTGFISQAPADLEAAQEAGASIKSSGRPRSIGTPSIADDPRWWLQGMTSARPEMLPPSLRALYQPNSSGNVTF